jgi:hypothetical protein
MAVQFTEDQFAQLMDRLGQAQGAPGAGGGQAMAAGAASVVGQLGPCALGRNKLKRYKKFLDWMRDAESKISFLGITGGPQKISFLRSCAGPELTQFWDKEARIRFQAVEADQDRGIVAEAAHSYEQIVDESKKTLLKIINRDRAIIDMMRMTQGDKTFNEFLAEVEDQEHLCRADEQRITSDDLKRMALIAGMKDRSLAEKCIGEEYALKQVIQAGVNRENSRANVEAMQAKGVSQVKKMDGKERSYSEGDMDSRINELQAELEDVMRVRKNGKYSGRFNKEDKESRKDCQKCTYKHGKERKCPAEGRKCNKCQVEGHFAGSALCRGKPIQDARRVEDETDSDSSDTQWAGEDYQPVMRFNDTLNDSREWPGVKNGAKVKQLRLVAGAKEKRKRKSRHLTLDMGGHVVKLYCDTGSRYTIIPPELYKDEMGKLEQAETDLRAWGADTFLDVRGMFRTKLVTRRGATKKTKVYVVAGTRPEPLLGDWDAEDLGIITFDAKGREPTEKERTARVCRLKEKKVECSIPAKLRRAGIPVKTEKPEEKTIPATEKETTMKIVKGFMGSVFTDKIGHMKTNPVRLQYKAGFQAVQPRRYGVPYHYQDRLGAHLDKLKAEGIIEDVDPAEVVDIVLNVAISEKKAARGTARDAGPIRMNIDARPMNVGARQTKYHVITPQEVRHQLQGANVFTEMDMGNGFHQVPLHPDSHVVFQTHRGLHRMKRLFFGPKSSSGIFHHEVQKAFEGVEGCITIHDNILVFGKDVEHHNRNLEGTLRRAKEKGVTLKITKSTFCAAQVNWFGRIFSAAGVSADPQKIQIIIEAGRPTSTDDVRSLLQAAAYNAKFAFDHKEDETYEEVTAPLRELLVKGRHFEWDGRKEESYGKLMRMMSDRSILVPFDHSKKTHLVTDASPLGIAASLYQEDEAGNWRPVDHVSRALSPTEQRWDSQIDWESLAKVWGMLLFRHFLIGVHFTSWSDHFPLLPFYNDLNKPAPVRVTKHRNKICDLTFTDKFLKGEVVPADYNSRHPRPIDHLSEEEREQLHVDDGEDVQIMRVMMADLPDALDTEMIKEAALSDPVYQKLVVAVRSGNKRLDRDLIPYTSVWSELGVIDGIVCRGERIVIPDGHLARDEGNVREWVVELGHSGHMGVDATKRLLRQRLWFPGMDKAVERQVSGCLPCQAATRSYQRDPLKPNTAPEEPWYRLSCDHWGPTRDGKHILVIIDNLTRYPEAIVVNGTGAEDNIHAFSEVFSRHGYPKIVHTDNGPPFNGNDSHLLQEYFRGIGVKHIPNHSAEDPEATGIVEAFMKHLKKIFHTAEAAYQDPYLQMNDHLMMVRAAPHQSTGKSPAELLFNRKFVTRLPDMRINPAKDRSDIKEAREMDAKAKAKMKEQKDKGRLVKAHRIEVGDHVLLARKTNKHLGPYDPKPFRVTETWGTQILAERDGEEKKRDAQRWKKVVIKKKTNFKVPRRDGEREAEDPDVGANRNGEEARRAQDRGLRPNLREEQDRGPGPNLREELPEAMQENPARPDIEARLERHPDIILAETRTNRPSRERRPPREIYQPEGSGMRSRATKKLPRAKL